MMATHDNASAALDQEAIQQLDDLWQKVPPSPPTPPKYVIWWFTNTQTPSRAYLPADKVMFDSFYANIESKPLQRVFIRPSHPHRRLILRSEPSHPED